MTTIGHPRTVSGGRSGPPAIAAECLFVDPISDLAVLGPPDNQGLSAEYEAYEKLMAPAAPLSIAPCRERPRRDGCCRSTAHGSPAA